MTGRNYEENYLKYYLCCLFGGFLLLLSYDFYRDSQKTDIALTVEIKIKEFCDKNRRYPSQNEFILLFPKISRMKDLNYWVHENKREAMFQYPKNLSLPTERNYRKFSQLLEIKFNKAITNPCNL